MGAKNVPKTKGKGIYRTIKGEKVKLTNRQIKAEIMKNMGLTSEQYKKQYDILRNKLRAFENYQAAMGKQVERQSVQELFYKKSRAIARYGEGYKGSQQMQLIESFSSVSSGVAGKKALTSKSYRKRRTSAYSKAVVSRFAGLIEKNPNANAIYEALKDNPVQMEKALAEFANRMHLTLSNDYKKQASQAIPYGTTTGSPDSDAGIDIDDFINAYM